MKRLRIEQRKDEPADIWCLRAMSMAFPHMDDNQKYAMARWMWDRVSDEFRKNGTLLYSRVSA